MKYGSRHSTSVAVLLFEFDTKMVIADLHPWQEVGELNRRRGELNTL